MKTASSFLWVKQKVEKVPFMFKSLLKGEPPFWIHLFALTILALAFVEWAQYGMFTLIRFGLCALFVRLSWGAAKNKDVRFVWIWGSFAAAYNPFVPLAFGAAVWWWVNLVTAGVIVIDMLRLAPAPFKSAKIVVSIGVVLVLSWGGVLVWPYFSDALRDLWDKRKQEPVQKKKYEGRDFGLSDEEINAIIRESYPSDNEPLNPDRLDLEVLRRMVNGDSPNAEQQGYEETWSEQELRKKEG